MIDTVASSMRNRKRSNIRAGVIGALSPRISGVRTGQTDLLVSTTISGPSDQVPWFRGS
jgi:hypothetical protein